MSTLTVENYVKTIYTLLQQQSSETAATGEIAAALEVSPGTVTSMLKTLSESGLAEYTPYEGVSLTKSGRALALRVLRRHRLIELFLVKTLDLSWDEVHEEAENMEHAVSDFLVDQMDKYLGLPDTDPHGDPIPKSDGTVRQNKTISLWEHSAESEFTLVRVIDQSSDFLRYLSEVHLEIGSQGSIVNRSSEGATMTVQIGDFSTTLSKQIAEKLRVNA